MMAARLQWVGDALVRAAEVGGLELFRDLFLPLLMNLEWQAANRGSFMTDKPYEPLAKDSWSLQACWLKPDAARTGIFPGMN
jgi:hypothetical protein